MNKCKYYLSHDAERRQIAQNGFGKIEEKHSVLMSDLKRYLIGCLIEEKGGCTCGVKKGLCAVYE